MNSASNTLRPLLAVVFGMLFALAAYAGEPKYGELVLSDVKDGTAKQVFGPTTPKIFLSTKLVDVPTGAKLKAAWIAEKTKVAPPNYQIDSTELNVGSLMNRATFSMTKPNAGWPPGDYRVDLAINGKLVNTVRFKVAP
jgi:hypothetical protein